METVRAKFYVTSKLETPVWGEKGGYKASVMTQVKLAPIYETGSDGHNKHTENHIFSKATPSGDITLQIANKAAADAFKSGHAYYIDFTPAD